MTSGLPETVPTQWEQDARRFSTGKIPSCLPDAPIHAVHRMSGQSREARFISLNGPASAVPYVQGREADYYYYYYSAEGWSEVRRSKRLNCCF